MPYTRNDLRNTAAIINKALDSALGAGVGNRYLATYRYDYSAVDLLGTVEKVPNQVIRTVVTGKPKECATGMYEHAFWQLHDHHMNISKAPA
jgi:hypothetical protein